MGFNYTQAGWASGSSDVFPSATGAIGPEFRLRGGGLVRPRLVLLAELAASSPLLIDGIAMIGLGAGGRWYGGAEGTFHVDAGVRRAWGYRYGIGTTGLPFARSGCWRSASAPSRAPVGSTAGGAWRCSAAWCPRPPVTGTRRASA